MTWYFDDVALVLFWSAFALLAYVYVGYPLAVRLRAAVRAHPPRHRDIEPSVSVVIVAFNEQERIARRLENLLALDYPPEKLEIILASDGSTDLTVDRARAYLDRGVTVRAFERRRGKAAVLNDVVPAATGAVVVLGDARQEFEPAAIRALVANFADPSVGAVSGELVIVSNATTVGAGASFYWRYEKFIRRHESLANSTVGATGALYALRRTLFEPIPDDTILDDVVIPVRIVRRGFRVVFEPLARAYDAASTSPRQEFVRKVRTIAGTFQLFSRERWLLSPVGNRVWFEAVSHKGLRLLIPALHVVLLAANAALIGAALYRWMFLGQALFYAAGAAGHLIGGRRSIALIRVPYTICLLVWATVVGFVYFATRRQRVTWERVSDIRDLVIE